MSASSCSRSCHQPGATRCTMATNRRLAPVATPKKKPRCKDVSDGLAASFWLEKHTVDSKLKVEKSQVVINSYTRHIDQQCECVPDFSLQYSTGIAYFEQFLAQLQLFCEKVMAEEPHIADTVNRNTADTDDPRDNPHRPQKSEKTRPSRLLYYTIPYLVNTVRQDELLHPLTQALHHWDEATVMLQDKAKAYSQAAVTSELSKLKIAQYLNNAFHALQCYNLLEQQEKCAYILYKISAVNVSVVDSLLAKLNACCMCLRVSIDKGQLNRLSVLVDRGNHVESSILKQSSNDYFEVYLFRLLKVEVDLHIGDRMQAGKRLKELLNSKYVEVLSYNRYYFKGLAFLLATQFRPEHYEYRRDHSEFTEPVRHGTKLLYRYFGPLFDMKSENVETPDQPWLRFAALSLAMKGFEVYSQFCIGAGMPFDLCHQCNGLFRVARANCLTFW